MNRRPLSEPPRSPAISRYFLPVLGTAFLLAGCITLWFLFIQPMRHFLQARSWTPTECKITESSVQLISDSDGSTYQPKIKFEYFVQGQARSSSRYSFFPVSSGRKWAEEIVAKYPTGKRTTCYYDPARPSEAVLLKDLRERGFWFGALFPWPFIITGGLILLFAWRAQRTGTEHLSTNHSVVNVLTGEEGQQSHSSAPQEFSTAESNIPESSGSTKQVASSRYSDRANWKAFIGPQKLKATSSRIGAVIGLCFASLIWNAIIVLITYRAFEDRAWFQLLFMTPFVIAGLILIGTTLYSFLRLFNPTVELAISEGAVPLGDSLDVAWELKGRVRRIKELTISALGEEQATYTRGTDTRTDRNIFQSIEIARTSVLADMQFGTATLTIPSATMHSHAGEKNKIVWKLVVQGEIPYFPNVQEEFEFRVIPRGTT